MRKNPLRTASTAILLLTIVFCIVAIRGHSWMAVRYTDIDINSGDHRKQLRVCGIPITSRIRQSRLSEEARRLGIDLGARRVWRRAYEAPLVPGVYVDYTYGRVISDCGLVVNLLHVADAPDTYRRVVLERLMTTLRTGTADDAIRDGDDLLVEIDRKYSLNALDFVDTPPATDQREVDADGIEVR